MRESRIPGLIADIEMGKQSLLRILVHQSQVVDASDVETEFFLTSAGGVVLHDFYNTVEKTFQQIALELDGAIPAGDAWHQQLLQRMSAPVHGRRPAVIGPDLAGELIEYLRFRHLFRHIYGFELEWQRVRPLLENLPTVAAEFMRQLDTFLGYLRDVAET